MKRLDPDGTGTGEKALSRYLRSEAGKNVYSLAGAWVVPHIEAVHRLVLLDIQSVKQEGPVVTLVELAVAEPPREAFVTKKSTLSRLKELD